MSFSVCRVAFGPISIASDLSLWPRTRRRRLGTDPHRYPTARHPLETSMTRNDSRSADLQPGNRPATSRIAVVTGASSGIGAATALRLARGGLTVALVARRADRLTEVAARVADNGGTAAAYPADLTDATARERVITQIAAGLGPIGVPGNNAGQRYSRAFPT